MLVQFVQALQERTLVKQVAEEQRPATSSTGITHLIDALGYSRQGLVHAFRSESAFRQELALLVAALPLAAWISQSAGQFLLLIAAVILVLVIELINSALERIIDRLIPAYDNDAGAAKDMGSAAVALSLLVTAMVWLAVALDNAGWSY